MRANVPCFPKTPGAQAPLISGSWRNRRKGIIKVALTLRHLERTCSLWIQDESMARELDWRQCC